MKNFRVGQKNQQTKYHILDSLLKVDICEIDQFHSRQSAMLLSIFTSNRNIDGDHVMRFSNDVTLLYFEATLSDLYICYKR